MYRIALVEIDLVFVKLYGYLTLALLLVPQRRAFHSASGLSKVIIIVNARCR